MAHRVTIAGSVLLSAILPTLAQERFAVEGDDYSGVATLSAERLEITGSKFSRSEKQGVPAPFDLTVRERSAALLKLVLVKQKGFAARLFGSDTTEVQVQLTARAGGGWQGAVEGLDLRLVPEAAPPADLVVLVVPGLSTNLWNQYGVPYLDENLAALAARGYSARRLAINTEASVGENAAVIAREIRSEVARGKRVLLLAHSKGGADAITAVSDPANKDLLPKIAGLIAIQPVYAGSLVADTVGQSSLIQAAADKAFSCIFPKLNRVDDSGSGDAVRDLRTSVRQELLAKHPYPAAQIPTVTIRGYFVDRWKDPDVRRHVLCVPLVGLQVFMKQRRGRDSDGMVDVGSQQIPGAKADHLYQDLDHFEPGFRSESPHTPSAITAKALELMLPHLKK